MPPTYKIENVPQAMRDLSVQGVRFVTHSMGPVRPEGQISYNHWTIFLLVQDGAIRLSMQNQDSNPNNNMGVLEISKLDYQTSRNATIYWDFPPMPSALVGHYLHNVYANGRHRYRMAEKGAGCRWWVYVQVCFYSTHLLTSSAVL